MARFIEFCKNRLDARLAAAGEIPLLRRLAEHQGRDAQDGHLHGLLCPQHQAAGAHRRGRSAKPNDAAKYNDLFEKIKAAFNRAYVGPDGRIEGDTQTDYVLALSFDLLDADRQKQAAQYLVENIEKRGWHLSTGFIGTKSLMLALAGIGRNDVA